MPACPLPPIGRGLASTSGRSKGEPADLAASAGAAGRNCLMSLSTVSASSSQAGSRSLSSLAKRHLWPLRGLRSRSVTISGNEDLGRPYREPPPEGSAPSLGHQEIALLGYPGDPSQIDPSRCEGRSQCTGQMRPALGPIQTLARERPALPLGLLHVHAKPFEERFPPSGKETVSLVVYAGEPDDIREFEVVDLESTGSRRAVFTSPSADWRPPPTRPDSGARRRLAPALRRRAARPARG